MLSTKVTRVSKNNVIDRKIYNLSTVIKKNIPDNEKERYLVEKKRSEDLAKENFEFISNVFETVKKFNDEDFGKTSRKEEAFLSQRYNVLFVDITNLNDEETTQIDYQGRKYECKIIPISKSNQSNIDDEMDQIESIGNCDEIFPITPEVNTISDNDNDHDNTARKGASIMLAEPFDIVVTSFEATCYGDVLISRNKKKKISYDIRKDDRLQTITLVSLKRPGSAREGKFPFVL